MEQKSKIIAVTHYLPISCTLGNDDTNQWIFTKRRGHTAMYSGIKSLLGDSSSLVHLGWTGPCCDQDKKEVCLSPDQEQQLTNELNSKMNFHPVFLQKGQSSGHYEGYCKTVLWPVLHYQQWQTVTDGRKEQQFWEDYVAVNQIYADAIASVYQEGDLIWIHDYHLLLVPQMLRRVIPSASIGFFLHAPWPSSEIFRALPRKKDVIQGLLYSNLIGFQTNSYARHFISCCTRVLGLETSLSSINFEGNIISVGVYPIGIDISYVTQQRDSDNVLKKKDFLRQVYGDKRIIVGRDTLDPVTGITQKLLAYKRFLEKYPEWRNKVVLVEVSSESNRNISNYVSKVSELIAEINGEYGTLDHSPVHHHPHYLDVDEYFALLSIADIGFNTSIRAGMNTSSHEYILCQHERNNPLIVSEFTGTAGLMDAAIKINPWNYDSVADSINEALLMSEDEKKIRHEKLFKYVYSNSSPDWAKKFVDALNLTISLNVASTITPLFNTDLFVEKFTSSSNRLICLDYDGTLTPIVETPEAALPPPQMLTALEKLCGDPKNEIWVISGRDQEFLEKHLGHIKNLGLSAEHGCFVKKPGADWENCVDNLDLSWRKDIMEIFKYYTERTTGSFIELKRCAITWHYRKADHDYGIFQARECQNHLQIALVSKLPVEILCGKKCLEVRPLAINKGEVIRRLINGKQNCDFFFCAGDDKTDEDMFRAAKTANLSPDHTFCCVIAPETRKTLASWHLPTSDHTVQVLSALASTYQ